jgi:predicted transcriptional regulator
MILHMEKQAISSHDVQQWHLQEIRAGIAEADSGQVIAHSGIKAMAASWRRPIDCRTSRGYFEES